MGHPVGIDRRIPAQYIIVMDHVKVGQYLSNTRYAFKGSKVLTEAIARTVVQWMEEGLGILFALDLTPAVLLLFKKKSGLNSSQSAPQISGIRVIARPRHSTLSPALIGISGKSCRPSPDVVFAA